MKVIVNFIRTLEYNTEMDIPEDDLELLKKEIVHISLKIRNL